MPQGFHGIAKSMLVGNISHNLCGIIRKNHQINSDLIAGIRRWKKKLLGNI
jgi:hypothetical protein